MASQKCTLLSLYHEGVTSAGAQEFLRTYARFNQKLLSTLAGLALERDVRICRQLARFPAECSDWTAFGVGAFGTHVCIKMQR